MVCMCVYICVLKVSVMKISIEIHNILTGSDKVRLWNVSLFSGLHELKVLHLLRSQESLVILLLWLHDQLKFPYPFEISIFNAVCSCIGKYLIYILISN